MHCKSVMCVSTSPVKPSRVVLSLREQSIRTASPFPPGANQALAPLMCNHNTTTVLSSACHFDQSLLSLHLPTRLPPTRNISYPSSHPRPRSSSHLSLSSDLQYSLPPLFSRSFFLALGQNTSVLTCNILFYSFLGGLPVMSH